MNERIKQKLIAEKDFLLKWLDIVYEATPVYDLKEATTNYNKFQESILLNWNNCEVSFFHIILDFYNERCLGFGKKFRNQVYRVTFQVYLENDYWVLEIREDSIDEDGYHCCPEDEKYLLICCFHEKEEYTFFDDNATQIFFDIYNQYQIIYPNKQLPDIATSIEFN